MHRRCCWPVAGNIAVAQWLRCCATNRKVAGSIPDGVIGIFHWRNPSDHTLALGSTQPLTEMSTMRISWGLRCCATIRRSLAQFRMVSLEFFIDDNSSDHTLALGSTQPLSTRKISGGLVRPVPKADNLTTFLEPSRPLQACNGTVLPLPLPYTRKRLDG